MLFIINDKYTFLALSLSLSLSLYTIAYQKGMNITLNYIVPKKKKTFLLKEGRLKVEKSLSIT